MMTIRRAVPGDERTVLAVLHLVQGWLHDQGHDQWPDGSPSLAPPAISVQVGRGDFWVVSDGLGPVAVIALSPAGDPDFWLPPELAVPAFYVSKAAVLRRAAGHGLGAMLLRWAVDHAWAGGARVVRLDVWKTNEALQKYYRRQGWAYLRTVDAPGRNSGALFSRPAGPAPEARAAFTMTSSEPRGPVVWPGMPVIVPADDGPVRAVCLRVTGDYSHGSPAGGWEHGEGGPPPVYVVQAGGAAWVARDAWPDPDGRVEWSAA